MKKIIVFIVLGFLIYSNILTAPFLFDDERTITNNPTTQNLDASIKNFFPNNTRYLSNLSFAINFATAGANTFPYHLSNLLIHILASVVVYQFALLLFESKKLKKSPLYKQREKIAFFTALIFLAHPIQTQAVSYISQRATSMAALFYLATLYFYLKARLYKQSEQFFFAFLAGLAAFYSKASAFSLPLMLLALEFFLLIRQQYKKRFVVLTLASLLLLTGVGFLIMDKSEATRIKISPLGEEITSYNYALTQPRVIVKYLQLLVLPLRQSADYYFPVSKNFTDPAFIISSVFLLSIIALAYKSHEKQPLISFAVFFFFIALSVESSILAIDDVIFEHRLYLPMFAFAVLLSIWLWQFLKHFKKTHLYKNISYAIIAVYCLLTFNRNFVWTNEVKFWADVVKKAPKKAKGYGALGVAYDKVGELDKAVEYYEKSLELNPNLTDLYIRLHNNLGFTKFKQGKYDEAISHYNKVLEVSPSFVQTHMNLAQLYATIGEHEKAIEQLEIAAKIQPGNFLIYHNLGVSYLEIRNYEKAENYLLKAYQLDPYNPQTRAALNKLATEKEVK